MPAILHFIQGEATLTLGDETVEAQPGTWIHMEPNLKHSVKTKTQVVMLLLLLKK
jgi:quercetin dioxygenase-like cupin family protein